MSKKSFEDLVAAANKPPKEATAEDYLEIQNAVFKAIVGKFLCEEGKDPEFVSIQPEEISRSAMIGFFAAFDYLLMEEMHDPMTIIARLRMTEQHFNQGCSTIVSRSFSRAAEELKPRRP